MNMFEASWRLLLFLSFTRNSRFALLLRHSIFSVSFTMSCGCTQILISWYAFSINSNAAM